MKLDIVVRTKDSCVTSTDARRNTTWVDCDFAVEGEQVSYVKLCFPEHVARTLKVGRRYCLTLDPAPVGRQRKIR